ncbi:MAG: glycosyltransferase family 4 protein [Planctomycetota bacterium]
MRQKQSYDKSSNCELNAPRANGMSTVMQPASTEIAPEAASSPSVAIASPFCWPEVRRGGERMHAELTTHLAKDGFDVTFLSSAKRGEAKNAEIPEGVAHRVVLERRDLLRFRHHFTPAHEFRLRAPSYIRSIKCDTFYALTYFDAAAFLAAHPRSPRPKLVTHSIGVPYRRVYRRVPWDGHMLARSIADADRVYVLSTFAADQTHKDYGRRPDVLPPPVNVGDFPAKETIPERPVILFSGDVNEPRKGADLLVRAVNTFKDCDPELVFSGAITEAREAELRGLSELPGERLSFLGTGRREDLPALYRSAKILVLPSQWEAFGLVLVEALASGTPVVAARMGGGSDIVDRAEIGTLFDADSDEPVGALARAIRETLEKASTLSSISACRARALDFTWERLGPAYREALI